MWTPFGAVPTWIYDLSYFLLPKRGRHSAITRLILPSHAHALAIVLFPCFATWLHETDRVSLRGRGDRSTRLGDIASFRAGGRYTGTGSLIMVCHMHATDTDGRAPSHIHMEARSAGAGRILKLVGKIIVGDGHRFGSIRYCDSRDRAGKSASLEREREGVRVSCSLLSLLLLLILILLSIITIILICVCVCNESPTARAARQLVGAFLHRVKIAMLQ